MTSWVWRTTGVLSALYGSYGQMGRAFDLGHKALRIAEEIGHRQWIALAQQVLGGLYLSVLALEQAQQYLEQALALARETGSLLFVQQSAAALSLAYISRGASSDLPRAEEILDAATSPEMNLQALGQKLGAYSRVELALARGKAADALRLADELQAVEKEIGQTLAGDRNVGTAEYRFRGKDGKYRWLSDNLTVLRDENGRPLYRLGMIRDATEQKRAEEHIRQLNRDLEQRAAELQAANKELESFSYSVSHDLRAPLASIRNFAGLLLEDYGRDLAPEVQRFVQLIHDNAVQMDQLVEGLLSFSRANRQPVNRKTIQTEKLVNEVLEGMHQEQDGRKVEVQVHPLPNCEADPVLLRQVWANLISNALKFTRRRETACIEIGAREKEGQTVFFVKDNGAGFDGQAADRLFGVFQRLHPAEEFEGTGVGLAIVDRIVRRHGGWVSAEGRVNEGAEFCFTLGSADSTAAAHQT